MDNIGRGCPLFTECPLLEVPQELPVNDTPNNGHNRKTLWGPKQSLSFNTRELLLLKIGKLIKNGCSET